MARFHVIFLLVAAFAMMAYASPKKKVDAESEVDHKSKVDRKSEVDRKSDVETKRKVDPEDEVDDEEDEEEADFSLLDLMDKSRRPPCSNRKCLRWYRGWWTKNCRARVVAYCEKANKYCCAHKCEAKGWCPTGTCVSKMSDCANGIVKGGCRGRQCYCCAP